MTALPAIGMTASYTDSVRYINRPAANYLIWTALAVTGITLPSTVTYLQAVRMALPASVPAVRCQLLGQLIKL
jgi:hypothetical protein